MLNLNCYENVEFMIGVPSEHYLSFNGEHKEFSYAWFYISNKDMLV